MNRILALKTSHTRSQTEISTKNQDCPEVNANLGPVENAEPVIEPVSHKARDPSSLEYIKLILLKLIFFNKKRLIKTKVLDYRKSSSFI